MRAIHDYIIVTDNRYNNTTDVDGTELILNTEITERDAEFVNRLATVAATPSARESEIEVGDQVLVHHNVFRRWYDMRGNEKNCRGYIDESTYMVSADQVFAYNRTGEWKGALGYCFVKPIEDDSMFREERYKKCQGVLTFTDKHMDDLGVKPGTIVGFRPGSEYEFTIDGEIYYRVLSNFLTIIYGLQEGTTTDNQVEQSSTATA